MLKMSKNTIEEKSEPLRRFGELARLAFTETLYPTRCAVCDAPGKTLCFTCARHLPYIDVVRACPVCGAPHGLLQCSECNRVLLEPFGYTEPPYTQAASAVFLNEDARRIVSIYKDQGEHRLARDIAVIMARYIAPAWAEEGAVVTYVPATKAAKRRRGFDHAESIAREVSFEAGLGFAPLLGPPKRLDQRTLGRSGRIQNMKHSMHIMEEVQVPRALILIDDVCTTGSTLFAATEALKAAGAEHIYALTFARA